MWPGDERWGEGEMESADEEGEKGGGAASVLLLLAVGEKWNQGGGTIVVSADQADAAGEGSVVRTDTCQNFEIQLNKNTTL